MVWDDYQEYADYQGSEAVGYGQSLFWEDAW